MFLRLSHENLFQGILKKVIRIFLDAVFPPRKDELLVRSLRYSELRRFVAPNKSENDQICSNMPSILSYGNEIVKAVIREAKFEGNMHAQMLLGKLLAEYCIKTISRKDQIIVIIPLPLGAKRLKERGYNQVEEICRYSLVYFKKNHVTAVLRPDLLVRTRETLPQTSLGRIERLKNMRNAFKVTTPLNPAYLYIVVDDVSTTGATLSAAFDALKPRDSTRPPQILAISLAK